MKTTARLVPDGPHKQSVREKFTVFSDCYCCKSTLMAGCSEINIYTKSMSVYVHFGEVWKGAPPISFLFFAGGLTVFYLKSFDMDSHSICQEKIVFVLAHLEGPHTAFARLKRQQLLNKERNRHLD